MSVYRRCFQFAVCHALTCCPATATACPRDFHMELLLVSRLVRKAMSSLHIYRDKRGVDLRVVSTTLPKHVTGKLGRLQLLKKAHRINTLRQINRTREDLETLRFQRANKEVSISVSIPCRQGGILTMCNVAPGICKVLHSVDHSTGNS